MKLSALVDVSRRVSETSKRLEKIAQLSNLLKQGNPEELEITVKYLSGSTRQGKTGIGWAAIQAAQRTPADSPSLELLEVDATLQAISATSGRGSEEQRRTLLARLFSQATDAEQQFLSRLLIGELRQGALEGIMVDAVAAAFALPVDRVRRASMMAGDLSLVAHAIREHGLGGLNQFSIQLFRPVQPMLAQSAEDTSEALTELGSASLEYKFDGARVQVHKSGDTVQVFSRRLNDVTSAVPEVVEAVSKMPGDLILDGEVLALTGEGHPHPFQVTMRRFGRKLDVEQMRQELPLTPVWFDLLYAGDTALIDEPQSVRFAELAMRSNPESLVPHLTTADPDAARDFLAQALRQGHEGIMAKSLDAAYAAGSRGAAWLKIKQARTLDLVVLAAEWGHGRRKGWLSNLHLGARDAVNGGFAMLGKTFKGLTDEMLAWQTQELLKLEVARDSYTVYVEPKLVVEIAFNEIQESPRYPSRLALRFARVKGYRPDKQAADADTLQTVEALAAAQLRG